MSWIKGRRRSIAKLISFTPQEWHDADRLFRVMHQSRGYKDFSEFARKMLTQGKVEQVVVATDPAQLRGEIGRIGSNINQIAHRANTADTATKQMLEQVLVEQKKLTTLFLQLNDDYESKAS